MKKFVAAATVILALNAIPANAASVTIDSSNCNSNGGCYGLVWKLTVTQLASPTLFNGTLFDYSAMLEVTDDPLVSGTSSVVISAVDFKATTDPTAASLFSVPVSSSGWSTSLQGLNSGGCSGSGNGFICSQTSTDPANFTGSNTAQTWGWYFNTSSAIFTNLVGAHIGAKLTDLSTPGKLLSASYTVPEPGTLALLASGLIGALGLRARRRTRA
jgi:hypothetical protein